MKIAFFSDIHGNLPALEKAIEDAGAVDSFIILGDVVNYGPWSNECVQLLESLQNCTKIKGNHEDYFISGKCGSDNYLANEFFNVCYDEFMESSSIAAYQSGYLFEGKVCTHTINEKYIYKDTAIELDNDYIIGHSHRQYEVQRNSYTLINPGSVGQNRQYINEINYIIYNTDTKSFDLRGFVYDVDVLINEMKARCYPSFCIDYYYNKKRI